MKTVSTESLVYDSYNIQLYYIVWISKIIFFQSNEEKLIDLINNNNNNNNSIVCVLFLALGPNPVLMICPTCRNQIITRTYKSPSTQAYIFCLLMILVGYVYNNNIY